ncbi:unnamed protein product, partial [Mesorhabditis belari]|uniref:Uncharacterized protein n=1 Tax=Mesorhabditis belari TaxID=2138241 RepID=A0AAF3FE83_9BILA
MVKFAAILTKLSNIAGYQQLIVSNGNASPKMEQDPDVFEQEEFEDDSQSDGSDENISMLPRFSILQDYTAVTVTQRRGATGLAAPKPTIRGSLSGRSIY